MPDLLERLRAALEGRYAVESEIGRGGMATVFLAEDLKHDRKVAIKVLHPELSVTLAAERFLSEIKIAAGLNHPHILALFDSGEADGLLYYVMPYVSGESLRHRLEREGQLPVEEAVRIAVEVADGLQHAHEQGVIHRDVKPGNILLSGRHAVITDFGIARAITVAQGGRVTSTGLGVGTPLYASPEQVMGAETLDGRTDVYSLGCVLYEMLSGQVPLAASTPQAVQARRMSEMPGPIHALRDTVPPLLDQVIAKALTRLPADRWESAEAYAQALLTATMDATPVARLDLAATPGVLSTTPTDVAPVPRKRRTAWLVAVVAVVGAAAAAWFAAQRMTAPETGSEASASVTDAMREVQLTSVGDVWVSAISPDGEYVAYCTFDQLNAYQQRARLMLVEIADLEASRELAKLDFCGAIRWLPDGSAVVVIGTIMGRGGSYLVSRYGDQPRQVSCGSGGFAISPDGTLCASRGPDDRSIVASSLDGSILADTISVAGEYGYLGIIDWLPDGRLSYETGSSPGFGTIWALGLDDAVRDSVVSMKNPFDRWWSGNGRVIYYMRGANAGEGSDLWRLSISEDGTPDGDPELLISNWEWATDLSFSADGRRAVFKKEATRSRIVRVSVDPEAGPPAGVVSPIVNWTDGYVDVQVSHSGESIAYASPEGLFSVSVEGGSPRLLSTGGRLPSWSPDDRFLVYIADWQDSTRLWIVPSDGRSYPGMVEDEEHGVWAGQWPQWHGPQIYAQTAGNPSNIRVLDSLRAWSRERQDWIALSEARGVDTDLQRGVRTAGRWLFSNDSVGDFIITPETASPDGTQLLVGWRRTMDGSRATDSTTLLGLWRMSLDGTVQTQVSEDFTGVIPLHWDAEGLYTYDSYEFASRFVYLQPWGGSERRLLLELPESVGFCNLLPSTDEIEVICEEEERTTDAWLIENFDPHVN